MKKNSILSSLPVLIAFVFVGVFAWLIASAFFSNKAGDVQPESKSSEEETEEPIVEDEEPEETKPTGPGYSPMTNVASSNCTIKYGNLMLINPNFHVEQEYITNRKAELISLSYNYGIEEGNPYNGDNLMDATAAAHMYDMVNAYKAEYPGHVIETRSCYRVRGTTCGRLCLPTGQTDHHTGLTCDLIDPAYGTSLDTSLYNRHIEWQWLKANSYKYGFIDRFPLAWAGGSMSEPMNVNADGSTGLYETWHYRYVGVEAATEIATGKYNNGQYDSLEHYLKATGLVTDLVSATCKTD